VPFFPRSPWRFSPVGRALATGGSAFWNVRILQRLFGRALPRQHTTNDGIPLLGPRVAPTIQKYRCFRVAKGQTHRWRAAPGRFPYHHIHFWRPHTAAEDTIPRGLEGRVRTTMARFVATSDGTYLAFYRAFAGWTLRDICGRTQWILPFIDTRRGVA